jgi:predicted nuclease of predicted toxin-antitoxin system
MPLLGEVWQSLVRDPFLIDECLSPDLVGLAHARGHHATHVVFRGLAGVRDDELMPVIRKEGFIFVTNNAKDFRKLYSLENIHAGLVIIVPGGAPTPAQLRFFTNALDVLETMPDLVNRILEVYSDGSVVIQNLP